MPNRMWDDPTVPPPGKRTGAGSASILPYLARTLAAKPKASAPPLHDGMPQAGEQHTRDQQQAGMRH